MNDDEIRVLRTRLLRLLRLAESRAPATIRAHYLMSVIVPTMIRAVGVRAAAEEMTKIYARAFALHTGTCTNCLTAPSSVGDYCDKCHTEFEAFEAEIDRADPDIVDDVPPAFLQFVTRNAAATGVEVTPDEVRTIQTNFNRAVRERAQLMGVACPISEMETTAWIARLLKKAGAGL